MYLSGEFWLSTPDFRLQALRTGVKFQELIVGECFAPPLEAFASSAASLKFFINFNIFER